MALEPDSLLINFNKLSESEQIRIALEHSLREENLHGTAGAQAGVVMGAGERPIPPPIQPKRTSSQELDLDLITAIENSVHDGAKGSYNRDIFSPNRDIFSPHGDSGSRLSLIHSTKRSHFFNEPVYRSAEHLGHEVTDEMLHEFAFGTPDSHESKFQDEESRIVELSLLTAEAEAVERQARERRIKEETNLSIELSVVSLEEDEMLRQKTRATIEAQALREIEASFLSIGAGLGAESTVASHSRGEELSDKKENTPKTNENMPHGNANITASSEVKNQLEQNQIAFSSRRASFEAYIQDIQKKIKTYMLSADPQENIANLNAILNAVTQIVPVLEREIQTENHLIAYYKQSNQSSETIKHETIITIASFEKHTLMKIIEELQNAIEEQEKRWSKHMEKQTTELLRSTAMREVEIARQYAEQHAAEQRTRLARLRMEQLCQSANSAEAAKAAGPAQTAETAGPGPGAPLELLGLGAAASVDHGAPSAAAPARQDTRHRG